jgi:hypothetical protein
MAAEQPTRQEDSVGERNGAIAPLGALDPAADGEARAGLLIDWGGVLTTNLFASFHAYCLRAQIDPQTLRSRFSSDPAFRELLIALEKGELQEEAFELRLAPLLGVESAGLIDGLFAGVEPDVPMVEGAAGRRANRACFELVGRASLPARPLRRALRRRRDLRRRGHPQALAPHVRARRRARRGAGGALRVRRRSTVQPHPGGRARYGDCSPHQRREDDSRAGATARGRVARWPTATRNGRLALEEAARRLGA